MTPKKTKWIKRIGNLFPLLCLCMVLSSPIAVFAENSGTPCVESECNGTYENGICTVCGKVCYLAYDETTKTFKTEAAAAKPIPTTGTKWESGWYYVQGDVTLGSRVEVSGDVKLILCDGAKLTVNDGIRVVLSGNTFTIYAQSVETSASLGKLIAQAPDAYSAGIGEEVWGGGTIIIHGGDITATGGKFRAGIGGSSSSITIHGGNITATGGNQAGISGKTITINGGVVTAIGTNGAFYILPEITAYSQTWAGETQETLSAVVATDTDTYTKSNAVRIRFDLVSADIIWTSMEFTYIDGNWDPQSHDYVGGGWSTQGGTVTVKNNCNINIKATFSWTSAIENISASFTQNGFTLLTSESNTTTLSLSGKPNGAMKNEPLGSVVVKLDAIRSGFRFKQGKTYYFNENGEMLTGWQTFDEKKYHFDENGVLSIGVCTIDNVGYFFGKDGSMGIGWQTDANGNKYYANTDGHLLTGLQTIDETEYYFYPADFDTPYVMTTEIPGWKLINKYRYYIDPVTFTKVTGTQTIDGVTYTFRDDGILADGYISEGKYYRNGSDEYLTGWQTTNDGCTYYFDPSTGEMFEAGFHTIDGKIYYFCESSFGMLNSLLRATEKTFNAMDKIYGVERDGTTYFDAEYAVSSGWVEIDGKTRYYLNATTYATDVCYTDLECYLCFQRDGDIYLPGKGFYGITKPGTKSSRWYFFQQNQVVDPIGSRNYDDDLSRYMELGDNYAIRYGLAKVKRNGTYMYFYINDYKFKYNTTTETGWIVGKEAIYYIYDMWRGVAKGTDSLAYNGVTSSYDFDDYYRCINPPEELKTQYKEKWGKDYQLSD